MCRPHDRPALALPEGRHYEMVSPPYKGGYGALLLLATAMQGGGEGEGVVFDSPGDFAGSPAGAVTGSYLAHRTESEWSTSPLLPPASLTSAPVLNDISPTLQGLYYGATGPNEWAAEGEAKWSFMFHDLNTPNIEANFLTPTTKQIFGLPLEPIAGQFAFQGANSSDPGFCHITFFGEKRAPLLPEAEGAVAGQLYELTTGAPGCGEEPALRLVAVDNELGHHHEPQLIDSQCATGLGQQFNYVAAGGSEIFFAPCENAPGPLFVRLGRVADGAGLGGRS